MDLDDRDFDRAVEELRAMARTGASTGSLLEFAKTTVAVHSTPIHAVVAFYRAFSIPLMVATSLGAGRDSTKRIRVSPPRTWSPSSVSSSDRTSGERRGRLRQG